MLTFRDTFESPVVRLSEFTCCARRHPPAVEEEATGNTIVLLRHGVFEKHFGRRRVTADPNQAVFFTQGSTYKVSHPGESGDRGTVLSFAPVLLSELVARRDPTVEARPDRPFRFGSGPSTPVALLHYRRLLALTTGPNRDHERMAIERAALELGNALLHSASAVAAIPTPRRRAETAKAQSELVERTKAHLAARPGDSHSLADVGRAVGCSPFHLSRLFRERTGIPLHRYLVMLRLRTALDRIADGERDLSSLAMELGFASHSHFTVVFHEHFGQTPSHLRRTDPRRALRAIGSLPRP
jgi:AraC family transcriptional regulator